MTEICRVEYTSLNGGRVRVDFHNCITSAHLTREYKTRKAAHAQGTIFENKMARIYSTYRFIDHSTGKLLTYCDLYEIYLNDNEFRAGNACNDFASWLEFEKVPSNIEEI